MTMDYSLMSFEHFRHFLEFQDFGPRPCTIALCLFKIFSIFGKSYKSTKNDMLYDHDHGLPDLTVAYAVWHV